MFNMDEKQKYFCLDWETENLNCLMDNRPWEVGAVICQGNKILERYSEMIFWENINVSAGAAIVTGFNLEHYKKNAKPAKEVLDKINRYIYDEGYKIITFNGLNFDTYVCQIARREIGLKTDYSYTPRMIDVHALYKGYKYEMPYNKKQDNFVAWQYKLLSMYKKGTKTNLSAAAKEFGITVDESLRHSGLADIIYTFELWNKLKYKLDL